MRREEFREKLRSIEEKVEEFEKLQERVGMVSRTLNSKIKRNEINTRQIIDEYLQERKSQLKVEEIEFRKRLAKLEEEVREKLEQLERDEKFLEDQRKQDSEALIRLFDEKSQGFPWLAKAYADYSHLRDIKIANWMEKKTHPAQRSAEILREISSKKRETQRKFRITKYLLEMYESLFPFLIDFRGEDLDDYIRVRLERYDQEKKKPEDGIIIYTTEGERETLAKKELFQRALDRYWQKKKSPWEIGRDYERYIGYLYESKKYTVYYQGIVEGLEDLGRDLIAKRGNEIEVIQCKYWSQNKTIHEKHICQLFGTTLKYWVENQKDLRNELRIQQELFPELIQKKQIKGIFVTSTSLSETAREFAKELGIVVKEEFPFQKYPSIKCNVSRSTGEKIYHLPFDQQYDRTIVEEERNECYVETVAEAEDLGFRRAYRWRGNKEE
jgi:hypothetical protein